MSSRLQPSPSLPNLRARSSADLPRPPHDPDAKRPRQQHYLTPPLTPASSLRSDSTDTDPPAAPRTDSPSADAAQSRFLIIGNVPCDLSEDVVGPYFRSLAAPTDGPSSASENVIQSIYYCFQDKLAIVLAFYDTRDAVRVKHLIEASASQNHPPKNSPSCLPWVDSLTCLFVPPDHFLLGNAAATATTRTEGSFCLSAGGSLPERDNGYSGWSRVRFFVPVKLKSVLAKYGEIKSFRLLREDEEKCDQLFVVEYHDVRAGELAWESLNGRVVENMKLRLFHRDTLRASSAQRDPEKEDLAGLEGHHLGGGHAAEPKTPTASTYLSHSQTIVAASSGVPFPLLNDAGPCDHEGANAATTLDPSSPLNSHKSSIPERSKPASRYPGDTIELSTDHSSPMVHPHERPCPFPPDHFARRGSNNHLFDAVRSRTHNRSAEADHMRTTNVNAFDRSQACPFEAVGGTADLCTPPCSGAQPPFVHDYFTHADRFAGDASMQPPWVSSSLAHGVQYPVSTQSPMPPMCSSICWDASTGTWVAWGAPGMLPEQWPAFSPSPGYYHGATSQHVPYSYPPHASPPLAPHLYGTNPHRVYPVTYPASPRTPPENNQLDIRKIEQGLDTRTTVMIKNIPNKMTDKELIAYINKICPRRIDFLYLRMDFQNGCNVGYAFVNFIGVEDLLRFAKTTLGEKWNLYSSEKVLQMSYANYQGKEALVEKFKNSCIMDEREEWRPKIFFSDPGPKQGLAEEFPKPTHMRRKERSSYNRGALFVPGITGGTGYPKTYLTATGSHQRGSRSSQGDERQRKASYPANDNKVQ